ncbi:glycosyltransferase family 4 protein [Ideonella livida]|uniref:Glycosyltransferase family 4 protein n=1 Tax=Ideonella livida TaxID=2707176 RepID=A0A7C9PFW3_9BURK|nr:glycosyltransferase family 4 protein [Ideonella livida]NDY90896.1 glycosyltransferase family 4 protein [Ideonella livida]
MSATGPTPLFTVAFLACNRNADRYWQDASYLYRCGNLGLALRARGVRVLHGHYSRWPAHRRADVVVLHRPRWTLSLAWHWRRLQRSAGRLLADVDDLIFLPDAAEDSPAVRNGLATTADMRRQYQAHAQALTRVAGLSVSTEPLLEEATRLHGQASLPAATPAPAWLHLLPNAAYAGWRCAAAPPATQAPDRHAPPRLLRYLAGTRSHDRDLALVEGPLRALLDRHPQLRLDIVGQVDSTALSGHPRVQLHPRVPFSRYQPWVQQADLLLAPLENTRFNRCKSALKWIEGGCWGRPVLGSPLPDALRLDPEAPTAPADPEAWQALLERAVSEPGWSLDAGERLRASVQARAQVQALVDPWLRWAGLDA